MRRGKKPDLEMLAKSRQALADCDGNMARAAAQLGVSYQTLYMRLRPKPANKSAAATPRTPAAEWKLTHHELWEAYAIDKANLDLRNRLIELHKPLASQAARGYFAHLPEVVTFEELESAAYGGLIRAVEGFDLARRMQFATYAALRLRGAMQDYLRELDQTPRLMRQRQKRIAQMRQILEQQNGWPPSDAELAARLDLELWQVKQLSDGIVIGSLNQTVADGENKQRTIADVLADGKSELPGRGLQFEQFINKVFAGLRMEEKVLAYLYHFRGKTMKQIGQALDISESRVSQLHSDILGRLAKQLDRTELFAEAGR